MKTIKLLSTAAFIFIAVLMGINTKAQAIKPGQWRLGIGLEALKGTGDFGEMTGLGLGVTPRLQYGLSDNVAFTFTSGYYHFFGKTYTLNTVTPFGTTTATANGADAGIVPVKAGIKAFFTSSLYFGAEAGAGFETNGTGNVKLALAPALGYANKSWEVSARYENLSGSGAYGFIGLRAAYGFGL